MTHKTDRELLEEIQQRSIRTETRMMQLGDHVGANLRSKQRIDIEPTPHSVVAYVDSYDVSLSRLLAEIKQSEYFKLCKPGAHMAQVRMGDRRDYLVIGEVAFNVDRSNA